MLCEGPRKVTNQSEGCPRGKEQGWAPFLVHSQLFFLVSGSFIISMYSCYLHIDFLKQIIKKYVHQNTNSCCL